MDATWILFAASLAAGFVGALMGVGGGLILVPVMVGVLHVPTPLAVGASLVAVIATSGAAAPAFLERRLVNLRLGVLMSVAAVAGALVGVAIGKLSGGRVVALAFMGMLGFAIWTMFQGRRDRPLPPGATGPRARRWGLGGAYQDPATGERVAYGVRRVVPGFLLFAVAGLSSGLLGVGGGLFQVPIMDRVLRLPFKANSATSNFVMGISGAAGATAYLVLGDVHPLLAGPALVGVLLGAKAGSRVMPRLRTGVLRWIFLALLVAMMVQMGAAALRG